MTDCSRLVHAHRVSTQQDLHLSADDNDIYTCDDQPCPHRLSALYITDTDEEFVRCMPENIQISPRPPSPVFDIIAPPQEEEMAQQLTPAEIMNTIAGLAVATNTIQQSLWTLLDRSTTAGTDKSLIQKPSPYTGKSSPDACHFIAAFTLHAQDTGTKLNERVMVGTELRWKLGDQKWIRTALSFLQDEAAVWAMPYIEKMVKDKIAFPTWMTSVQPSSCSLRLKMSLQMQRRHFANCISRSCQYPRT